MATQSLRIQNGSKSLDDVLEIVRLRIDAETQYTNSLQKIIGRSNKLISGGNAQETLNSAGLNALHCDMENGIFHLLKMHETPCPIQHL